MNASSYTFAPSLLNQPLHTRFDLSATPWRLITLDYKRDICCLVDAVDYSWLVANAWNVWWSGRARWQLYAKRNVGPDRATVRMHREILQRADPQPGHVAALLHGDHVNGQTLDNRRGNLRWLTPEENRKNTHARERIPSIEMILYRLIDRPEASVLRTLPF